MQKGLIYIITGDGKGKTTAAMGLALRAAGHNKKVLIIQFVKDGKWNSGEIKYIKIYSSQGSIIREKQIKSTRI